MPDDYEDEDHVKIPRDEFPGDVIRREQQQQREAEHRRQQQAPEGFEFHESGDDIVPGVGARRDRNANHAELPIAPDFRQIPLSKLHEDYWLKLPGNNEDICVGLKGDKLQIAREPRVSAANGSGGAEPQPPSPPLVYVNLARAPIPEREWLVPDRIPMRNITLLSGEGAIGKSLLLMQLSAAVVMQHLWLGSTTLSGPAIYLSCEEDEDEICHRMEIIARSLGSSRQDLIDKGLRFLSYAGRDAILAQPDRAGVMHPTPLFEALKRDAVELQPKLIAIDTAADTFAGEERNRAQTRQFITMLRGMAIEANAAGVLCAHPSLEGIRSDTGLSGSTGWHNSVRARMYFKTAGDNSDLRSLECKKNNYGPVSETLVLRWRDGVFVHEPGAGSLEHLAREQEIDDLFMALVRRFRDQNRAASDRPSSAYAPIVFAKEPEARQQNVSKEDFADSMARLLTARKVEIVTIGPRSRQTHRLIPTMADQPRSAPKFQFLGPEPEAPCEQCGEHGDVYLIRNPLQGVASHALHEDCAAAFFDRKDEP